MSNRFWELLGLYWRNEISKEEMAELEQLLLEHPEAWLKSGQLNQLSFTKKPVMDEAAAESLADNVLERIAAMDADAALPAPPPKRRPAGKLWIAACCLLLVAGGIYFSGILSPAELKVVTTDAGMKTRIRLSDGTMMWLNAGSTVKYPQKFGKTAREVYLSGEAYFDVTQDANRPFIIHTDKMNIRVLGTSFNVRSYKDEKFSETALISGAVEVTVQEAGAVRRVLLKPREKLVVREPADVKTKGGKDKTAGEPQNVIEQTKISVVPSPDSSLVIETAWLSNQLIFQNETMESISRRMERWYGTTIIIEKPELSTLRFSGRADNLPLEKLLSVLREIQPFEYTVQGDTVIIR
ncbi:FecR family protein [Chitinophaga barathri]|uniref:FecR family protein n=1 Tax=Chitinophaga barathri TaxID=1647451 RepID=A0A3N4M9S7_9BACT|nr:FecR family protein [Chitinophaga barathri]RPD38097.1 FecR family protein [Chitinophaga barathri]